MSAILNPDLQTNNTVSWSSHEVLFQNRPILLHPNFVDDDVPFDIVNYVKLKRSYFGPFIQSLNYQQHQDMCLNETKLAILEFNLKQCSENELQYIENDNDFSSDLYGLLARAVDENEVIEDEVFYKNILTLKYTDLPLNIIDAELTRFLNLRILILSGNWIEDIFGNCLPRRLQYLELYGNLIKSVKNFCMDTPKRLVHIGFKRNALTDGSRLHLLGNRERFKFLRSLDLSDNDICDLRGILLGLCLLKELFSLQLQGNPCAVLPSYKTDVLRSLEGLVFLDNAKILAEDRDLEENDCYNVPAIVFTCHRIMALPPPKKEKGIVHAFYMEVFMPLLEHPQVSSSSINTEMTDEKSKKKGGSSKKSETSSKKSSKKGKKGNSSPYDAPDEQASDRQQRKKPGSFQTERFAWEKIKQLPEDVLEMESWNDSAIAVRDSFKTSVNVKLVYLKILPPQKPKKGKGKDKKKSKGPKDKKSSEASSAEPPEEPKETILKKVTLANFWCDLHSINWSDTTIDFYWADHPKTQPKAAEVEGSLRAIMYGSGGKKGKKDKNDKKDKKDQPSKDTQQPVVVSEKVPAIFTCQVGFGLRRNYTQIHTH